MRIFDTVKRQIIRDLEKLEPHTRLQGRQALCDQYFVSRDTIDRVIASLCEEGYLYTIKNSGTFVADPSISLNISCKLPPQTIGVLMPTSGINSSIRVAQGIDDYAAEHNLNMIHCITGHNVQKLESYTRRLLLSGISGLLIQAPSVKCSYEEISEIIRQAGIPTVFMFNTFPSLSNYPLVTVSNVNPDDILFVFDRGYKRMAFASNHGNFNSCTCLRNYLDTLARRGIEDDYRYVLVEEFLPREQFIRMTQQKLLAREDQPDMIYCYNDTEAGMVYEAIKRMGLRISDDVGVIGSDNSPIAAQMDPPLTSIDINAYEIGYTAASWVAQFVLTGNIPRRKLKIFQAKVMDRASCAGPRSH